MAVDADSGAIGGAASQEYMVTAAAGEDLILTSSDGLYAANQEKASSLPAPAQPLDDGPERILETPNQISIEQLCAANDLEPSQTVKVLVLLARLDDGREQPILVSLRGDQDMNDVKLANAVSVRSMPRYWRSGLSPKISSASRIFQSFLSGPSALI